MTLKSLFAHSSAKTQLLILFILLIIGLIFGSLIGLPIYAAAGGESNTYALRILQTFSAGGVFLFPALVISHLCGRTMAEYLSLRTTANIKVWLAVLIAMLAALPIIILTAELNSSLTLPAFMSPVEEWMQSTEAAAEALVTTLLSDKGAWAYAANLFTIAIFPGISEELFFRGALQRIMEKRIVNHHTLIWLVALVFGIIHLQFYGLLPRVLLGAYFGYILYWTKSIWLAAFAHFINNALVVTASSLTALKGTSIVTNEISHGEMLIYLAATPISILIIFLCSRFISRARPAASD